MLECGCTELQRGGACAACWPTTGSRIHFFVLRLGQTSRQPSVVSARTISVTNFIESVVLIKVTNGYGECTARARSAARHRPAARGTTARPNHRGMRPAAKKGMLQKVCYCIVESSINSVPPDGPSAYVTCHKWPPHTTAAGLLTALLLLLLNRSNATSRSVCCRKQQRTTFRSSRLTTRGLWDPKDPSMS
jgi:hypothetical protein